MLPGSPATPDNLSSQQWNLEMIGAFQAQTITGGSPDVRVALIDSGIDPGHPEFAGRIDTANSVSCIGGAPNQSPAAWMDDNGHGTHTAGTIAAAKNGLGIVGPTRMDYPGNMAAVRAVARYVGHLLAES